MLKTISVPANFNLQLHFFSKIFVSSKKSKYLCSVKMTSEGAIFIKLDLFDKTGNIIPQ